MSEHRNIPISNFSKSHIILTPYKDMSNHELMECLVAHDSHHEEHHQVEERLKDNLRTVYTRLESLYRIIYGVHSLGEKITDNSHYVALRYLEDSRPLMADSEGWTGRKCPVCNGTGSRDGLIGDNSPHIMTCGDCAGTGNENVLYNQN